MSEKSIPQSRNWSHKSAATALEKHVGGRGDVVICHDCPSMRDLIALLRAAPTARRTECCGGMVYGSGGEGQYPCADCPSKTIEIETASGNVYEVEAPVFAPSETQAIKGEKSRALYQPARSIAQEGDTHLYVHHNGLWYHFPPKDWKEPANAAKR
jgi:hypothetical protein